VSINTDKKIRFFIDIFNYRLVEIHVLGIFEQLNIVCLDELWG